MNIANAWDDTNLPWPKLVYISTTNVCNANCICCVNDRHKKARGIMSLENFKLMADKIKANGAMIGAFFVGENPV